MNKYTELSDLEINKRVFVVAKIEHEDTDLHSNKVFYGDGARWIEFNPCNNPTDAMPIIIENKIGLSPMYHSNKWTADCLDYDFMSVNKNPYRGAMEVFLMMKDTENNQ
ncbi:TPA: phage protein NinX family protein [Proteus mirabilis]